MSDDIQKRIEEIRAHNDGAYRPGGQMLLRRQRRPQLDLREIALCEQAPTRIDWLLTQLEASRRECERLRAVICTPHPGMPSWPKLDPMEQDAINATYNALEDEEVLDE